MHRQIRSRDGEGQRVQGRPACGDAGLVWLRPDRCVSALGQHADEGKDVGHAPAEPFGGLHRTCDEVGWALGGRDARAPRGPPRECAPARRNRTATPTPPVLRSHCKPRGRALRCRTPAVSVGLVSMRVVRSAWSRRKDSVRRSSSRSERATPMRSSVVVAAMAAAHVVVDVAELVDVPVGELLDRASTHSTADTRRQALRGE